MAVADPGVPIPLLTVVALLLGVGIDLDHFPLARLNRGDWTALRRCFRDPRIVLVDQDAIFDEGEVGAGRRLVSHALIGGVAVAALWVVIPPLGWVIGLVVLTHLGMDVVHDWLSVEAADGRLKKP